MALGDAMKSSPKDYGPLADMVASMRDSIAADVSAKIASDIAGAVARAVAGVAPQVTIQAPPAPNVTVTPNIQVDVPGEDDAGEIRAMNANTEVLKQISNQLGTLTQLLSTPTTTTVERGSNQLITKTVESR